MRGEIMKFNKYLFFEVQVNITLRADDVESLLKSLPSDDSGIIEHILQEAGIDTD